VRRQDDAGRARAFRSPDDCAEVVRVGDLVEANEERRVAAGELPGVGIPERRGPRDEPLVVARPRRLAQNPLRLDLRARTVREPRARARGPLGRPDLEHVTRAPIELADGVPPVDELARHKMRTRR
jgi:hypothetical protein